MQNVSGNFPDPWSSNRSRVSPRAKPILGGDPKSESKGLFKLERMRKQFSSLIFVAAAVASMQTLNRIPYEPNGRDVVFAFVLI